MIHDEDDFGGPDLPPIETVTPEAPRENLIPFPDLRPNTKLGQLWASEVARSNKDAKQKLKLVSPLAALRDLERQRALPEMPWPQAWPELGKRCRTYAGQCVGITGPTGGGKTSFAIQIAIANIAEGIPVLWLPKELDAPELDIRIVANMVAMHTARLRDEWTIKQFDHALSAIDDLWRFVDNVRTNDDQMDAIRTAIQIAKRVYRRPPLFIVDYMGKFGRGTKDPRLAISDAAETLRELILSEEACALLLNQTSRSNDATLTGQKELESATQAVTVSGESSEIEHACSVMIGLNVFKVDDADALDAHVLVAKARNTGREGREGFRFSKPGGVWHELPYLPATPGEVSIENKRAASAAKKAKTDAPDKVTTRKEVNVERAGSAERERANRITAALARAGVHGLTTKELRKIPGTGSAQTMQRTLQELEHRQTVERLAGSKRWRLIPRGHDR